MNIQHLIDTQSKAWRSERSATHLTLGELILKLKAINQQGNPQVRFRGDGIPREFVSYRGYYSDLAIEYDGTSCDVMDLLDRAQQALGATFTGYKGGEFLMDKATPLWKSMYGMADQVAIVDLTWNKDDNVAYLETKETGL